MVRWLISPLQGGEFEVKKNGRDALRFDDLESAQRYIRRQMKSSDRVLLRENDGYLTQITRTVLRFR